MKKIFEPIVFFGSGPVAAESLGLLAEDFCIEAVITKPRPEHHHGEVHVASEAKKIGLQIYEAGDKLSLEAIFTTARLRSRLAVLVDFGIIVSQKVIDFFPLGIVNSHFSLLPEWRGADPITFSILSGQKQTGVSLMLLVQKMDEGPILVQKAITISPNETTGTLTEKLIELSNSLLHQTLPGYISGKIKPKTQNVTTPATYSRRLTKEDGRIVWEKPAAQLEREIRAFASWPKSYTRLGNIEATITAAHVSDGSGKPGCLDIRGKQLCVFTGKDVLVIDRLKPAGKKEMDMAAFLAGYKAQL